MPRPSNRPEPVASIPISLAPCSCIGGQAAKVRNGGRAAAAQRGRPAVTVKSGDLFRPGVSDHRKRQSDEGCTALGLQMSRQGGLVMSELPTIGSMQSSVANAATFGYQTARLKLKVKRLGAYSMPRITSTRVPALTLTPELFTSRS